MPSAAAAPRGTRAEPPRRQLIWSTSRLRRRRRDVIHQLDARPAVHGDKRVQRQQPRDELSRRDAGAARGGGAKLLQMPLLQLRLDKSLAATAHLWVA